MSDQFSELLPLVDACRLAGVQYREAWAAVADGRVPAKRKGCRWLVAASQLVSALKGAREGTTNVSAA
jgi:hypothetical protein